MSLEQLRQAIRKREPPIEGLACRKGCAHCCRTFVRATAPDVLLLLAHLREVWKPDALEQLKTSLRHASKLEREKGREPPCVCPLLKDNECQVYASRPSACAHHVSFRVEECAEVEKRVLASDNTPYRVEVPVAAGVAQDQEDRFLIRSLFGPDMPRGIRFAFWGALSELLDLPFSVEYWVNHTSELLHVLWKWRADA